MTKLSASNCRSDELVGFPQKHCLSPLGTVWGMFVTTHSSPRYAYRNITALYMSNIYAQGYMIYIIWRAAVLFYTSVIYVYIK